VRLRLIGCQSALCCWGSRVCWQNASTFPQGDGRERPLLPGCTLALLLLLLQPAQVMQAWHEREESLSGKTALQLATTNYGICVELMQKNGLL